MASGRGASAALAILLAAMMVGTTPAAGDRQPLVIQDPEGDTGDLPCSPAIDLLELRVAWGDDGVLLDYTFRDLSEVGSPIAMLHDVQGGCFWSYTDFVADFQAGQVEDSIFIDHVAFPAAVTGWRFYLHDEWIELPGSVDGDRIHVTLPYALIGEPAPGDRFGDFDIQVNTRVATPVHDQDRVPDYGVPCACWLEY